jgi:xanthosine utilization system XapX-like protein
VPAPYLVAVVGLVGARGIGYKRIVAVPARRVAGAGASPAGQGTVVSRMPYTPGACRDEAPTVVADVLSLSSH